MSPPLLEVCVESLPEAIAAVEAGADRLELCGAMSEAGITPGIGLVEAVVGSVAAPVFVMIRPRGGDFTYEEDDVGVMLREIAAVQRAGAHGVVSGALEATGGVDRETTRRLVEAAAPLPLTFHRAVDLTPNLEVSLQELRAAGVKRILTSGGATSALVGAGQIARLVRQAGPDLTIVAGGGVRAGHVAELVRQTAVREVHARPVRPKPNRPPRGPNLPFGPMSLLADRQELDPAQVRALADELRRI